MAEKSVTVHGVDYPFPEDFTMGELADVEEIVGQGYDFDKPGIRSTLATVFIAVRRVDSNVTIKDIRALKLEDFEVKGEPSLPLVTVSDDKPNDSDEPSSDSSNTTSEPSPDAHLNGTGTPDSAIGATLPSETLNG